MKLKKAEFRKSIDLKNLLAEVNNFTSCLFDYKDELSNQEQNYCKSLDFDQIFRILHLNYKNPRAMNCFILYDITDNKLRVQLAKYLLAKGCQHVQKSVFLGNISKSIFNEIFSTISDLEPIYSDQDSIFMVPIGEYHLAEMKIVGKDVDMSFSRANEYVLYF